MTSSKKRVIALAAAALLAVAAPARGDANPAPRCPGTAGGGEARRPTGRPPRVKPPGIETAGWAVTVMREHDRSHST